MVITGTWADGRPLLAIPNYARLNLAGQRTPGVRSEVWFKASN